MPLIKYFENYPEVIEYLYGQLALFQKYGGKALKPGLQNIRLLCENLGQPHLAYPSIHIAGTNGKGSTANLIAATLQSAGYKTGLFTSPHLKSFTERIRINGQQISDNQVVDFVNQHISLIDEIKPSFFEITAAMAFKHFALEAVDVAVIEVGMGGRLDSTNIIEPVLSVITNVSYDHQQYLGDTLEKIATEKAGIIKKETPVVIGQFQEETYPVFKEKAKAMNTNIYLSSDVFGIQEDQHNKGFHIYQEDKIYLKNVKPDLKGKYQQKNILTTVQSIEVLKEMNWKISDEHIIQGIEQCTKLTGFKGRWQVLGNNPLIICDIAHNEDAIQAVFQQIETYSYHRLHIITGFSQDKDIKKLLNYYPTNAFYYFCQYNSPRTLNSYTLRDTALSAGLIGEAYHSVESALSTAKQNADQEDLIFITGSAFVIAELDI